MRGKLRFSALAMKNASLALKLIRIRFNLTQQEVSEKTGINAKSIPDLEAGRVSVSLEQVASYAQMAGLSTAALVNFIEQFSDDSYLIPPLIRDRKPNTDKTTDIQPRVNKVKTTRKRSV